MNTFRARPDVEYAEPDFLYHPLLVPDDPSFGQLWGLQNTGQSVDGVSGTADADIDGPEAWDQAGSAAGETVVAVIDTGVDYTHEDLAGAMWVNPGEGPVEDGIDNDGNGAGLNCGASGNCEMYVDDIHGIDPYDGEGDPLDGANHGTHLAGTIAAIGNNATGVAGVAWSAAWNVKIMACRFLGPQGGSTSDAITCLEYVQYMKDQKGVNIVATNNSWGGSSFSQALKDAIQANIQSGIAFVTAAGNDSTDNDSFPQYPASYEFSGAGEVDGLIAVAATDQNDNLSSFSNFGVTSVDVGAPGSRILSSLNGGGDYIPALGDPYFEDFESGGGGPGVLSLAGPVPGTAGTTNTFTVTDADPGASITVYRANQPGSDTVASCAVGLNNARLFATDTADASGTASPSRFVPNGVSGKTLYFQAVDPAGCAVSAVVSHTFGASGSSASNLQPATTASGGWAGQGTWQTVSTGTCSGWDDSPGGDYANNTDASVTSPTIDLSGVTGSVRLGFVVDHDLENGYDFLYPEISRDGGANWSTLGEINGENVNDQRYVFAVPNRYKTASFRARFRLQSDFIITKGGVCVEEVGIGFGTGSDTYAYFFGTSMATPHVAGLYALLASQSPSSTVSDLKAAILDNVDALTALNGKVVTGGRINADKALQSLGGGGGGPGMDLLDPTPGQAGTTNTFDLTGADPGAALSLYRSTKTGSTSVGACTVDLNNAKLTQTAIADGSGNASFQVVVPSGATGKTFRFQVVDDSSCAVSDVVSSTF